ncbi:MAG: hypothetical protein HOO00_09325 [Rhodospirillaceae bacterium]|jgi:hypothetical protein|nr:hypothetical protein [Rhodospirillaceae bacterium]MBT5374330.1 hypothetical protein [Rhodospirillaceae bacterium]MBT5658787.1 hypothetical protein [Rhodospirillaceae bacterium]MBT5752581.1 hypothetical protein [Rhodospirillaceae bacterium]
MTEPKLKRLSTSGLVISGFCLALLISSPLAAGKLAIPDGGFNRDTPPNFDLVCYEQGYVSISRGWIVCRELERMAWGLDPDQWIEDYLSPPGPTPSKLEETPPDHDPYPYVLR